MSTPEAPQPQDELSIAREGVAHLQEAIVAMPELRPIVFPQSEGAAYYGEAGLQMLALGLSAFTTVKPSAWDVVGKSPFAAHYQTGETLPLRRDPMTGALGPAYYLFSPQVARRIIEENLGLFPDFTPSTDINVYMHNFLRRYPSSSRNPHTIAKAGVLYGYPSQAAIEAGNYLETREQLRSHRITLPLAELRVINAWYQRPTIESQAAFEVILRRRFGELDEDQVQYLLRARPYKSFSDVIWTTDPVIGDAFLEHQRRVYAGSGIEALAHGT